MTEIAKGGFEVLIEPLPLEHGGQGGKLGRMSIDKTVFGDLVATTQGQMLTAATATSGSAGYVAMEQVTGTLKGRRGSFILQHSATMNRGEPSMRINVVPDSGTDELTGLTGDFAIWMDDGKHHYEFSYRFADEHVGSCRK